MNVYGAVDDGENPEPVGVSSSVIEGGQHLAPLLHYCFLRNAYNVEHPPVLATAPYEPLAVRILKMIIQREFTVVLTVVL